MGSSQSPGKIGHFGCFVELLPMAFLLFALLLAGLQSTGAQIGVCYGMLGNNLPPPSQVIQLYNRNNIRRMRIYGPNREVLQALRGTNIELMLDVGNDRLEFVSSSQANADSWVRDNVLNYRDVRFRYIVVGNEVKPNDRLAQFLVGAIRNIQNAVNSANLGSRVKVSTAFEYGFMGRSFPPRDGAFKGEYIGLLRPILAILKANRAPLMLNLYPFFSRYYDPANVPLDYALFRAPADPNSQYKNLFDAMLDATYYALEREGAGELNVVVSESGWPSAGGGDPTTVDNARTYINNLVRHVKGGTPKRPGGPIETYIFAMFDEGNKGGLELEKHFGLFSPGQQSKYGTRFE